MCSFVSLNESIAQHVNELLPQYTVKIMIVNGSLIYHLPTSEKCAFLSTKYQVSSTKTYRLQAFNKLN
jgi:hypothetical protein